MFKKNKIKFTITIIAIFIGCHIVIDLIKNNVSLEDYFEKHYSPSLKEAIKTGYYRIELQATPNATQEEKNKILHDNTLKKMKCDDIDHLYYTLDNLKGNKNFIVYEFSNIPCPSGTMRIADIEEELKRVPQQERETLKKQLEKENDIVANKSKRKDNADLRRKRRLDTRRILNYGNHKFYNRYVKKDCDGMDNLSRNLRLFPDTFFTVQGDNLEIHEGVYFIIYDKKNKVYHAFKEYGSQNERPDIPYTRYELFYRKIKNVNELDYEFQFLFNAFNLKF